MEHNYLEDIKINEDDLPNEWLIQASLFLHYAEAQAEALHVKDLAKSQMDYTFATLYSNIKKNWKEYFDSKPTEAAIKENINCSKEYREAGRNYIDATKDANILLAAKTAFEHRKMALSNLVSLKIGGFYGEPRNKRREVETLMEKGGKQLHNSQKEALNKRRRKKDKAD